MCGVPGAQGEGRVSESIGTEHKVDLQDTAAVCTAANERRTVISTRPAGRPPMVMSKKTTGLAMVLEEEEEDALCCRWDGVVGWLCDQDQSACGAGQSQIPIEWIRHIQATGCGNSTTRFALVVLLLSRPAAVCCRPYCFSSSPVFFAPPPHTERGSDRASGTRGSGGNKPHGRSIACVQASQSIQRASNQIIRWVDSSPLPPRLRRYLREWFEEQENKTENVVGCVGFSATSVVSIINLCQVVGRRRKFLCW